MRGNVEAAGSIWGFVVRAANVHARVELLDGAVVRQQGWRCGGQFEVPEDLFDDDRVGEECQHDHGPWTMQPVADHPIGGQ